MRRAVGSLLVAVWLALLCAASVAARPFAVPDFTAGPRITPAGLAWLGASGPMLGSSKVSRRGAASFPLTGETSPPLTSSSSRWMLVDSEARVEAAKLGSGWQRLAVLSRCRPLTAASQPRGGSEQPGLIALTGGQLFAVVDPHCLHHSGYGRAAILSESLTTGSWRLLAPAPADTVAISASTDRLAVAIGDLGETGTLGQLAVRVYDARDGRFLYGVVADASERADGSPPRLQSPLALSVDAAGDVLVGETVRRSPPVPVGSFAWWATPSDRHAHQINEVLTSEAGRADSVPHRVPTPTADAALSAGRIAYAIQGGPGEQIELLDVRNQMTRVVARFPGEVGVLGLDLSPSELAWAQQSSLSEGHSERLPGGGIESECKQVVLSDAQLMSVQIRSLPTAGLTVGPPVPADTPPCPVES